MQLGKPVLIIARGQVYNIVLTRHALLIIFFIVMPTLMGGFGNYFLPLLLGLPDMIFPRTNLVSWWLLPGALALLVLRILIDSGRGTSWTFYPPLRSWGHSGGSVDCRIFSLHTAGVSSLVGRMNFITTTLKAKGPLTIEHFAVFL